MIFRLIRPGQSLRERAPASNSNLDTAAANAAEYRCCLCLHVKTGTLLLGLWQVWVQLFVVSFLLAVLINPSLLACIGGRLGVVGSSETTALSSASGSASGAAAATPAVVAHPNAEREKDSDLDISEPASSSIRLHGVGHSDHHLSTAGRHRLRRQDHALLLLIGCVSLLLALLLVIGTLRQRAKYLMPYFCMQLFDFVINCLTVVGYFSYLPDAKSWLSGHRWPHDAAVRKFLLGLDDATLGFVMLVACMLYLMAKAYLLGMVWACYKFLLRKEAGQLRAVRRTLGDFETATEDEDFEDASAAAGGVGPHPLMLPVPPKYEDALKQPANLNAPPPYFPGGYNNRAVEQPAAAPATAGGAN